MSFITADWLVQQKHLSARGRYNALIPLV